MKFKALPTEQRMHNFVSLEASVISKNISFGGSYDYNYAYYNGYNGAEYDGDERNDWTFKIPFKTFGPTKGAFHEQLKTTTSVTVESDNNKTFYGIDIGAGVKCLLGIDLSLKIGVEK
jgi:hypothetical protein